MKHERDQRESASPILTRLHERRDGLTCLGVGAVPDQPTSALKDPVGAERFHLRIDLFDPAPEPRCEPGDVKDRIRVTVEEHQDIPGEKRADMPLNEPDDGGSQNPF